MIDRYQCLGCGVPFAFERPRSPGVWMRKPVPCPHSGKMDPEHGVVLGESPLPVCPACGHVYVRREE